MFLAKDWQAICSMPRPAHSRIANASRSKSPDANPWYAQSNSGNNLRAINTSMIRHHSSFVGSTPVGFDAHACNNTMDLYTCVQKTVAVTESFAKRDTRTLPAFAPAQQSADPGPNHMLQDYNIQSILTQVPTARQGSHSATQFKQATTTELQKYGHARQHPRISWSGSPKRDLGCILSFL